MKDLQSIKARYGIVGNADGLNRALDIALQVAPTDLSVLITGESGVGKEVFPRLIHDHSVRKSKKYFAVNCGSIPEGTIDSELFGHEKGAFTGAIGEREGYFGSANGGTLFLDEVGELPLSTQARLLRVLESGEYIRVGSSEVRKTNVRIVAATNVNMQTAISEGRFREDLYYRLSTIPIRIPPLRERKNDVVLLFRKFALEISERYQMPQVELTDAAKQKLMDYPWPGNIRQLKNVTEQISVISEERVITPEVLESYVPSVTPSNQLVTLDRHSTQRPAEEHSYENDREMIYTVLSALRKEVTELKMMIRSGNVPEAPATTNALSTTPFVTALSPTEPTHAVTFPKAEDGETVEVVEDANSLDDIERQGILRALARNRGRRKYAAKDLGISERTLYRKIKDYGLD